MMKTELDLIEKESPDLGLTVNSWLYRVEEENWRTSSNYEEALDLLCQMVSKPDYENTRESLKKVRESEEVQEAYFRGREAKTEFEKTPGKIYSDLLKIGPHLCGDFSLISELFFRRSKIKFLIYHRLKALKAVGLNEESPEYPYLLGLSVATTARTRMFQPLVKKIFSWARLKDQRGKIELSEPRLIFSKLLLETEYWRGFSDETVAQLNQYANSVFGEDAEKAKSLWAMLWFAKTPRLGGKVKITPIIERAGSPLVARNWNEAKNVLYELASIYPEIFKIISLRELGLEPEELISFSQRLETARRKKERKKAKKREQIKTVLEFARLHPSTSGQTSNGRTLILVGVGRKEIFDKGTSLYRPSKECIIIKYESEKPTPFLRGGIFRTIYLAPKKFLARLHSGEYIFSELNVDSDGNLTITTEKPIDLKQ